MPLLAASVSRGLSLRLFSSPFFMASRSAATTAVTTPATGASAPALTLIPQLGGKNEDFDVDISTGNKDLVTRPMVPDPFLYKVGPNYPSKTVKPERDLVNFPQPKMREFSDRVVFAFIPRSFCEFFYQKTGVSGFYVFSGGMMTFLLSKEWFVIQHEFYNSLSLLLIGAIFHFKFKPQLEVWALERQAFEDRKFQHIQEGTMRGLQSLVKSEEKLQAEAHAQNILFDAKRENVAIQLEAAYRDRQMKVFNEVKKRVDYQAEVTNAEGRIKQQHMTHWIVSQVQKALTPDLEKKALRQCLVDLKTLAARA